MRRTLLLIASLLVACSRPAPPEPPPAPETKAEFVGHMKDHAQRAANGMAQLAAGELASFAVDFRWLAEHPSAQGIVPPWQPQLTRVREAAGAAASAGDVRGAAEGVVATAQACAVCHVDAGVTAFEQPPPRPSGNSLPDHMARHRWSLDRLWEGLAGPSDAAWKAGLAGLAMGPAEADDPGGTPYMDAAAEGLEAAVHSLAAEMLTKPREEAASSFPSLLEACVRCHQLTRPGTPGGRVPGEAQAPETSGR